MIQAEVVEVVVMQQQGYSPRGKSIEKCCGLLKILSNDRARDGDVHSTECPGACGNTTTTVVWEHCSRSHDCATLGADLSGDEEHGTTHQLHFTTTVIHISVVGHRKISIWKKGQNTSRSGMDKIVSVLVGSAAARKRAEEAEA